MTLQDGTYAGKVLPNTRENYLNEGRAILIEIVSLLGKLKELGIYDKTSILLQGDHGSQILARIDGKEIEADRPRIAALLSAKPATAKGAIQLSSALTSTLDTRATVSDMANITDSSRGTSVFSLDTASSPTRVREYITCTSHEQGNIVTKYYITGSGWENKAWKVVGRSKVEKEEVEYYFGDTVRFGMTGNGDSFLGKGWSIAFQMEKSCWSDGHHTILSFPTKPPDSNIELTAEFMPYIAKGACDKQRVIVSVNGEELTTWEATKTRITSRSITIPKELINRPITEISFNLPDAVSPRKIGTGGDARTLGICLINITMAPI